MPSRSNASVIGEPRGCARCEALDLRMSTQEHDAAEEYAQVADALKRSKESETELSAALSGSKEREAQLSAALALSEQAAKAMVAKLAELEQTITQQADHLLGEKALQRSLRWWRGTCFLLVVAAIALAYWSPSLLR